MAERKKKKNMVYDERGKYGKGRVEWASFRSILYCSATATAT